MNDVPSHPSTHPVVYRCSACARLFVAVGGDAHHEILCACGAKLCAETLPRGMYELASSEPCDIRVTAPGRAERAAPSAQTHDLGYGQSHGYGPAHGGPTGPGDSPGDPAR